MGKENNFPDLMFWHAFW